MWNKKIKIAFLAPISKWWPYYIYKDLVKWLNKKYPNELDVILFNSKKDWLKLHFVKYDYIFSVIPFVFKPLWTKKYIFNPRWNFELEKKKNKLWNKLLYLAINNLKFSDNVWLTSYFLADKLGFKNKYSDKMIIIENFVNFDDNKKIKDFNNKNELKVLTVSSTKFLEKGKWIIDLWKEISKIKNINIKWTIIAWWEEVNKIKLQNEFNDIIFWNNITIDWIDWVDKDKLINYYIESDIFIYWTRLDTFWTTILEAMSYWLPCILLEYELWKYIFPKEIISINIEKNLLEILNNYNKYSKESLKIVRDFSLDNSITKLHNFI